MNFYFNTLAAAAAETNPKLFFEPLNFVENLQYMGIGMLVIFVIIGVIILTTALISKLFSQKNGGEQN